MPAGFSVSNIYGTILVDENYSNLCLRAKGVAAVDYNGVMNPGVDTAYQAEYPMFVVGGNHAFTGSGAYINTGVNGPVGTAHGYAQAESNTTRTWYTMPYWFFDVAGPTHNSGCVVYRADGSVAFDAMNQHARVVDVLAGDSYETANETHTYPAGRTYGICILKSGYRDWEHTVVVQDPDAGAQYGVTTEHWSSVFTLNNNVLTIGQIHWVDEPVVPGPKGVSRNQYSKNWVVAVVDVTGY